MPDKILHRALSSEQDTRDLAARLALSARRGDVIALEGDLGAGKTVFARAFITALDGGNEVPSPTFTLVQSYDGTSGPIHHFDLYRLASPEDAFELGLEELLPDGISLIEWPDRLGPYMPKDYLTIRMIENSSTGRVVEAVGAGDWMCRLDDLKDLF
tara:strand:- start:491 stop:961 length:471 start_codon:yes stop_codon:yes gene_type:complete